MIHLLALLLPGPLHTVWQHSIEWMWWPESDHGYAFFSSVGGTPLFALGGFAAIYKVYRKHVECSVSECKRRGHVVHGTPYRACHEHHPGVEHKGREPITVEHIHKAHRRHLRRTAP